MTDPAYSALVLDRVTRGAYDATFAQVTSTIPGHSASFRIFSDALKIDGVRVGVSAQLQQQIADLLDCSLLTTKLADLLYAQRAVTLYPQPFAVASTTVAMLREDGLISAALAKAGGVETGGIVQSVGKHWVITNDLAKHPGMACNYGWNVPAGTKSPWEGIPVYPSVTETSMVIQQPGFMHNLLQFDESQNCIVVSRSCVVDGVTRDLGDVLQDKTLAPLASAEGVLQVLRQPGVAQMPVAIRPPATPPSDAGAVVAAALAVVTSYFAFT